MLGCKMNRQHTFSIFWRSSLFIGIVFITACADSKMRVLSTESVDACLITQDKAIISKAAKALDYSDSKQIGIFLEKVSGWEKPERKLLISGLEDSDPNVRYLCSMAFYVFASDLTYDEGLKAYDSLRDDVQARTALQISADWAIGWAKDRPPQSAMAIKERIQSILAQPSGQQATTQPLNTYDGDTKKGD